MRVFFSLVVSLLLTVTATAFAVDSSISAGKGKKESIESSTGTKESIEERTTKRQKEDRTKTVKIDKALQETLKKSEAIRNDKSLQLSLSIEAIFQPFFIELESSNTRFKSCRVFSEPKVPADFGLTAERDGMIDAVFANYLGQAAKSNMAVEKVVNPGPIIAYMECLYHYGKVIGQAYVNLSEAIKSIQIESLGMADIRLLAKEALMKAVKSQPDTEKTAIWQKGTCRFLGSVEVIRCGNAEMLLKEGQIPALKISNIDWFGSGFGGYRGSFTVNSGWSYTKALDYLKSLSKTESWAKSWAEGIEKALSEGRSVEAVALAKEAYESMLKGEIKATPLKERR